MSINIINKLSYSYIDSNVIVPLPDILLNSSKIIPYFFDNNQNNKLCLVFPSKEYSAQWLSVPLALALIEDDFAQFKNEIAETYKQFKKNDKLMLNGKAVVLWSGVKDNGVAFKTKGVGDSSGAEITIKFADVIKLQKVDTARKLSSLKTVTQVLPKRIITPTEKLLNIATYGNKEFIKNKICLISKFKSYCDSIERITMNGYSIPDFFHEARINENGESDLNSPLLISNNLSNLALYVTDSTTVSKIIIDGFSEILDRATDFSDIDAKKIPTILITDLSEIGNFETIGNYGFDFYNFNKENLRPNHPTNESPFYNLDRKIKNYISFNLIKVICENPELELITKKLHSITKDESNNDLNILKISLIQLTNQVSRIAHPLTTIDIGFLNSKIRAIESLFLSNRMWLGDSIMPIEESIELLKLLIEKFTLSPPEKWIKLHELIHSQKYDYIICPTEEEVNALNYSLQTADVKVPKIITISDVKDNLMSSEFQNAILTGWVKSNNTNRILFSFLFSELTVLFYQFENKYYNSLQKRNRKYSEHIKATINSKGGRSERGGVIPLGYDEMYSNDEISEIDSENPIDIVAFESDLDNAQYSKYLGKNNLVESVKAKRIDFDDNFFIYSTETHKFLVINELIEEQNVKANIYRRKIDALQTGDVIAIINTDKDILVELVEKNTNPKDFLEIKQWTDLWKILLKEYFIAINYDFQKLINDLRNNGCRKHEGTIRAWLQDENRIGPDDDADLICIAVLSKSNHLFENIDRVRAAISKMKGWRMKASDVISEKIKSQIHKYADNSIINTIVTIEGLGNVNFLRVIEKSAHWENIDFRYVNRLLAKEII